MVIDDDGAFVLKDAAFAGIEMKLLFEIAENEYHEAARAAARSGPDWYRPVRIVGYVSAAAGFALLFGAPPDQWLAPVLLVLVGLFLPIYPWLRQRSAVRDGWKNFSDPGPLTIDFSGECILSENQWGSARLTWYAFDGFTETPGLFLIHRRHSRQPLIVSKRALADPAQMAELRTLLETMLVRPAPAFPMKI